MAGPGEKASKSLPSSNTDSASEASMIASAQRSIGRAANDGNNKVFDEVIPHENAMAMVRDCRGRAMFTIVKRC